MASAKNRITSLSAAFSAADNTVVKDLFKRLVALRGDPKGSASETMDCWLKEGKAVTSPNLMVFVRQLRKYRDYKNALELMDWMEKKGVDMPVSNQAIRLELISKVKGIDMAEVYFSTLPHSSKNYKTYTALLASYCQRLMVEKALSLYEKMKELNLPLNSLVFNNLMTLYIKLAHPEKVCTLFQEMSAANILPDRITYGLLIKSYVLLNDINSVERVLKAEKVAFDWPIICTLSSFYNSLGLFEKSVSVLKNAEKVMTNHNRAPYEFLISLYAGAGKLEEVNRVWKLLKAASKKTTNKSYLNMLNGLRRLGDTDGLKQCFQEWQSSYKTYDVRVANLAMDVFLKNGMEEEAKLIWRKSVEKGVGGDIRTLELFTNYYSETGELDLVIEFLRMMVHAVRPNGWRSKVDELLKCIEKAKDVDGMEKFCEILKKLDCLDGKAYKSLLQTYLVGGRKDDSLRQRIEDDGIEISTDIEELLQSVCVIE